MTYEESMNYVCDNLRRIIKDIEEGKISVSNTEHQILGDVRSPFPFHQFSITFTKNEVNPLYTQLMERGY
jgi:hypothetical protein